MNDYFTRLTVTSRGVPFLDQNHAKVAMMCDLIRQAICLEDGSVEAKVAISAMITIIGDIISQTASDSDKTIDVLSMGLRQIVAKHREMGEETDERTS